MEIPNANTKNQDAPAKPALATPPPTTTNDRSAALPHKAMSPKRAMTATPKQAPSFSDQLKEMRWWPADQRKRVANLLEALANELRTGPDLSREVVRRMLERSPQPRLDQQPGQTPSQATQPKITPI